MLAPLLSSVELQKRQGPDTKNKLRATNTCTDVNASNKAKLDILLTSMVLSQSQKLMLKKMMMNHQNHLKNDDHEFQKQETKTNVPMRTVQSSPATACKNTLSEEHPAGVTGMNEELIESSSASAENHNISPAANALPLSERTTECCLEIETPTHLSSPGIETGVGVNKEVGAACPHLNGTRY